MNRQAGVFSFLLIGFLFFANTSFCEEELPVPSPLPSFRLSVQSVPTVLKTEKNPPANPQKKKKKSIPSPPQKSPVMVPYSERVSLDIGVRKKDRLELIFDWNTDTKAVMFRRGDLLWIAFDRPAFFDFSKALALKTKLFKDLQQHNQPQSAILHLRLPPNVNPYLEKKGNDWFLRISKKVAPKRARLSLSSQVSEKPVKHIQYQLKNPGPLISLKDPFVGDEVFLIPLEQTGGMKAKFMADYQFLTTLNGIAILPQNHGLNVQVVPSGFHISSPEGLLLSSMEDRTTKRTASLFKNLFDFKAWQKPVNKILFKAQKIFQEIREGPEGSRDKKRMELGKFFLAHGRFEEGLGSLKWAEKTSPRLRSDPYFLALKGLALTLCRNIEAAESIFELPVFKNESEIDLWQGFLELMEGNHQDGIALITPNLLYIKNYPQSLKNWIGFLGAKTSLALKTNGTFFTQLINPETLSARERDHYDLLVALVSKKSKDPEQTKGSLLKAFKSKNRKVKVEAYLKLARATEEPPSTEIKNLEDLQFRWRHDETELKVLKRLVYLYKTSHQPHKALLALRQIIEYYHNDEKHQENLIQGENLFFKFITQHKNLTPFQAITFYQKFKMFLPRDSRRYKILAQLVKSYISLDLFEDAAFLQEEYLKRPPKNPEDHFREILHLAKTHLKAENYKKFLKTLKRTHAIATENPELIQERIFLEAHMMLQKKTPEKALEILRTLKTPESLRFQGKITWENQNWNEASKLLTQLIQIQEKESDPETKEKKKPEPNLILNLAIAFAHMENQEGLKSLSQKYGSLMEDSPHKETFIIVTQPRKEPTSDYQKILKQSMDAKQFDKTLQDFKKKKA